MKASEFISEGEMHDWHKRGIPGMKSLGGIGQYYDIYRFGIMMAASGGDDPVLGDNARGTTEDNPTTVSYSSVDNDIIEKALKKMGKTAKTMTDPQSAEPDDTNTQSPMQPRGPVKRRS